MPHYLMEMKKKSTHSSEQASRFFPNLMAATQNGIEWFVWPPHAYMHA